MANLNALAIKREIKPGRYGDGGGLYLLVGPAGTKSWMYRYKFNNQERGMGLGAYPAVSLAAARLKAEKCRGVRRDGRDPLIVRDAARAQELLDAARAMTFKQCAEAFIASNESGWRNSKHKQQWRNTLATYAYPHIGDLSARSIDAPLVLKVLEPIWAKKPETAKRVRGRMEAVLDWAKVNKHRDGENPARWRGNLDHALPKISKVQRVRHHAALAYICMPEFLVRLRERVATAAIALEFLVLTAARTNEVLGARWTEIDEAAATWTIPADRMKAGKEHRVPLSPQGLAVLGRAKSLRHSDDYIFPGQALKKPLSNMALLVLLRRMERGDATAHGFRSTFRDWAAEQTNFPNEVVEMALAHAIANKVEAAYRRGDLFDKRRALMNAWGGYCLPATGDSNVLPMSKVAA